MTLREVLNQIDKFPSDAGVYLADQANLDAPAFVHHAEDGNPPAQMEGVPPVMDVWQVSETLDDLQRLLRQQTGIVPSQAQLIDRFLVYLKDDA